MGVSNMYIWVNRTDSLVSISTLRNEVHFPSFHAYYFFPFSSRTNFIILPYFREKGRLVMAKQQRYFRKKNNERWKILLQQNPRRVERNNVFTNCSVQGQTFIYLHLFLYKWSQWYKSPKQQSPFSLVQAVFLAILPTVFSVK